jgi:hypothetical protein
MPKVYYEDGGSKLLLNVVTHPPDFTVIVTQITIF